MATIHVDGKEYEVTERDNLLEAYARPDIPLLLLGIRRFGKRRCWCAVKQYQNAEDLRGSPGDVPVDTGFRWHLYFHLDDKKRNSSVKGNIIIVDQPPARLSVCEEGGNCAIFRI